MCFKADGPDVVGGLRLAPANRSAEFQLGEVQSRVVELRFFGGLTEGETAEILGISPRTVRREWTVARAWLFGFLSHGEMAKGE